MVIALFFVPFELAVADRLADVVELLVPVLPLPLEAVDAALGPQDLLLVLLELSDVLVEGLAVALDEEAEHELQDAVLGVDLGLQQRVEALVVVHEPPLYALELESAHSQQLLACFVFGELDDELSGRVPLVEGDDGVGEEDLIDEDGRIGALHHFSKHMALLPD